MALIKFYANNFRIYAQNIYIKNTLRLKTHSAEVVPSQCTAFSCIALTSCIFTSYIFNAPSSAPRPHRLSSETAGNYHNVSPSVAAVIAVAIGSGAGDTCSAAARRY